MLHQEARHIKIKTGSELPVFLPVYKLNLDVAALVQIKVYLDQMFK